LAAGTPLTWPDGTPAGKVRLTHRYAEGPTLRNGRHCVLAYAGRAAKAQLSWCAEKAAFVPQSYEQERPERTAPPRTDRERVTSILEQMGLEVSAAEAELIYQNLAADPDVLDELFAAEAAGELDSILPPPPPSPGITRKP
jgi:hypothetical protein